MVASFKNTSGSNLNPCLRHRENSDYRATSRMQKIHGVSFLSLEEESRGPKRESTFDFVESLAVACSIRLSRKLGIVFFH